MTTGQRRRDRRQPKDVNVTFDLGPVEGGAPDKASKNTTLLDEFQQALVSGHNIMAQNNDHMAASRTLAKLRTARSFTLGRDFLELAVRLSMETPSQIFQMWQSARPAYDTMWVEFDEALRSDLQTRANPLAGGEPLVSRTGYLIEASATDPCKYFASVVYESTRTAILKDHYLPLGQLGIGTVGVAIDIEKHCSLPHHDLSKTVPYTTFNLEDCDVEAFATALDNTTEGMDRDVRDRMLKAMERAYGAERMVRVVLMGRGYVARSFLDPGDVLDRDSIVPKARPHLAEMLDRMAPFVSPLTSLLDARMLGDILPKMHTGMIVAAEGDVRLIVAVLALLQSTWFEQTKVSRQWERRHVGKGRQAPFLEQHVLTIVAPKDRVITVGDLVRHDAHGSRRAHDVIGHYAYSLKRRPLAWETCSHLWKPVVEEPHQQQCARCGWRRWWRRAHTRGNAARGFASKSYNVIAPLGR